MAVSSIKDFWIHPNALTITLNYFGDPQLIQTSMLAGAVIMAYRKDVISYDAAHNFREWKLQAFPTQLNDTCAYYVHAELSRGGDTAMIIYSPVKRDIEGRTLLRVEKDENGRDVEVWNETTSTESYFIYLGIISASVDNDGATVERAWTDGFYTGTLDTDQQRMEDAAGEWKTMFNYNSVIGQIEPQKPFSKIKVMGEAIFQSIAQFVNGIVIGKRTITDVAASSDSGNESKVSDATLPTTGYVDKEIEALDDHFLIKDGEAAQKVGGDVTFKDNVTVQGDHTVKGDTDVQGITVHGQASMAGGATFGEFQDVAGSVQGAKVDDKGVGTFAGLKSKYFEIYELIYNQQTAEDGVKMFTDRGVIEEVKDITYYGNDRQGTYSDTDEYFKADALIKLRKERDGQLITFKKWDVIHGIVNSIGDSGEYAIGGEAWFRVVSVNQDTFEMEVEIYADRETPAGKNIVPTSSMVMARWGHKDGSTDDALRRQTSFYLSCEDGNITQLMYVTKPIIGLNNYGSVLGVLPPALYEYVQNSYAYVNPEQPYLYARGIAVQDLMLLDYLGQPIKQARYRGVWNYNTAASDDEPYVITETTYDTVTHNGSLWQLNVSYTTEPPSDDYGEWTKIVSKGDDSTATMYELKPSANIIYYRTAEKTLSINTLDVKVGQTTSHGYSVIDEQYVLEELGLKVSYAIDGVGERHYINISPVAAFLLEDGTAVIATEDGMGLSLEGDDIDVESIKDNITLYLTDTTTEEDMTSYIIPVVKDGEEGKEGKRGRMLYPAGDWDATKEYAIENNSAPFVKKGSTYYVLVWEGNAIQGELYVPDGEGNDIYWRPFTYMNYLFAEFLMANWAKFGSDKGGVFYDKYLFSQTGIKKDGTEGTFTKDMFDEHGNLTDEFTPNLLINFDEGEAMLGKLTEVYHRYPADTGLIRMGDYHNIIVTPDAGRYGSSLKVQGFSSPLIILPQMQKTKWPTNGAHISIFADVGDYYKYPLEGLNDAPVGGVYKQMSAFALISADDILDGVGLRTRGVYSGNWIVANGYRSKFMLLSPGCMIKLRLSYNENTSTSDDGTYNWVVEGGNEVQVTKSQIFARDLHWSSHSEATRKVPYQGYEWDRINNRGATLEFNWQAGDDENRPYYPVILTVGHVGDNLGATTINGDGVYLGHTKPNILLSTTQNGEGWYSKCYYRLVDAVNDEGYPDTDLE